MSKCKHCGREYYHSSRCPTGLTYVGLHPVAGGYTSPRKERTIGGKVGGTVIGAMAGGPVGALVGFLFGDLADD